MGRAEQNPLKFSYFPRKNFFERASPLPPISIPKVIHTEVPASEGFCCLRNKWRARGFILIRREYFRPIKNNVKLIIRVYKKLIII